MTNNTNNTMEMLHNLYKAAKTFSDSCSNNDGSEAADNGDYEQYFNSDAKYELDKILEEIKVVIGNPKGGP